MKFLITASILLVIVASATSSRVRFEDSSRQHIEERSGEGIVDLLQALSNLLKNIIGILDGNSSVQDLVTAIQGLTNTVGKMVNVQELVSYIPFIGSYLVPVVGGLATIVGDSTMLGGLLSQVLIGPSYS
ncbi:uncharacterized protein LOC130450312 [Diorhabda sublineata]|uniref:uncharacterized protein LOC130450312 n=1 Tax=Diorhabda sublineata TaxID=1163346 RepID=UPI0024E0B5B6|nr:uncharacterized protein LOC130450312 [Diorhabda sublineata]